MDNQDEVLANFTAITGSESVSARSILEVGDDFCVQGHGQLECQWVVKRWCVVCLSATELLGRFHPGYRI